MFSYLVFVVVSIFMTPAPLPKPFKLYLTKCRDFQNYRAAKVEQGLAKTMFSVGRYFAANWHYDRAIRFVGVGSSAIPGGIRIDDTGLSLVAAHSAFHHKHYLGAAQIKIPCYWGYGDTCKNPLTHLLAHKLHPGAYPTACANVMRLDRQRGRNPD